MLGETGGEKEGKKKKGVFYSEWSSFLFLGYQNDVVLVHVMNS